VILDDRGELIGRVTLPTNEIAAAVGRQLLWTIETDEFNVPSLVRYRIGS
jgi:hypothetical protein